MNRVQSRSHQSPISIPQIPQNTSSAMSAIKLSGVCEGNGTFKSDNDVIDDILNVTGFTPMGKQPMNGQTYHGGNPLMDNDDLDVDNINIEQNEQEGPNNEQFEDDFVVDGESDGETPENKTDDDDESDMFQTIQ